MTTFTSRGPAMVMFGLPADNCNGFEAAPRRSLCVEHGGRGASMNKISASHSVSNIPSCRRCEAPFQVEIAFCADWLISGIIPVVLESYASSPPRNWPGGIIRQRATGQLKGQLDLTVMVTLVPEHVLKQEDRVIVVNLHVRACLYRALDRLPHYPGAIVQHLCNAIGVRLGHPLFGRHGTGELGRVLGNEIRAAHSECA